MFKRSLLLWSAVVSVLLAAPAANAAPPAQRDVLFSGGGPSYVPPSLTAGLAIGFGNSLWGNAGGYGLALSSCASSCSATAVDTFSDSYGGVFPMLTGGAIQYSLHYNYGRGAQSTAGIAARENNANTACNAPGNNPNSACFTGKQGTSSGSTTTTALTLTASLACTNGQYIFSNGSGTQYYPPQTTIVSGCGTTSLVTSNAPVGTIPSGTLMSSSPTNQTNQFWNYLDATKVGFTVTDMDGNFSNTGQYSACSDPANVVIMSGTEINDANIPTLQMLKNLQSIVDGFVPRTGCNKVVISGDGIPYGMATAYNELHTVPASPYQVTVANSATFQQDLGVLYAPNGASGGGSAPNTLGASDGTPLTKVASAPAAGQYSVSGAVYTFNSADTGKQLVFHYTWAPSGAQTPAGSKFVIAHDWWDSKTCGTFVDGGTSYPGVVGAQCKLRHPNLIVAPTWNALVDPSTGTNNYNLPWTGFWDGATTKHPQPYGAILSGQTFVPALAKFAGTTPQIPAATFGNSTFTANASIGTGAVSPTCAYGSATTNLTHQYFLNGLVPAATAANSGVSPGPNTVYAVGMRIYASASNTGIPAGTTIDCIDITNNQIHLSAAATVGNTATGTIGVQGSTNNVMVNGLFNHLDATAPGSSVTNCENAGSTASLCGTPAGAASLVPNGWIFTPSSAQRTDLQSGNLGISYGIETNGEGDGYDDFIIQVFGTTSAGALNITLQQGGVNSVFNTALILAGDSHRTQCKVQISAGPNGHLWGVEWPKLQVAEAVGSGSYAPPGDPSSKYINFVSSVGGGAVGLDMSDQDLSGPLASGGVITTYLTTPNTYTGGMTSPTSSPEFIIQSDGGVSPVSATFRFSRCQDLKVTN